MGGLPKYSAAVNPIRSRAPRSGRGRKNDSAYKKLAGGSIYEGGPSPRVTDTLGVQTSSSPFEFRGPASQPTQGVDCTPVDLQLLEEGARGLRQPHLAILVLILATALMVAPGLIAGIELRNNFSVLTQGSPRSNLELSSLATYARVLVAVALAFVVVRTPREQ